MSSLPIISAIAAMDEKRVIGKDNQLPWHLPADLKHFKEITTGHAIIMGRKTYESIGKPLPHRLNLVISRNPDFLAPGCLMANSLKIAIQLANEKGAKEIFIIGGAEIFRLSLPLLQRLYLTIIHHNFEGDTFFPPIDNKDWIEVEKTTHLPDDKNTYSYSFITLERKTLS